VVTYLCGGYRVSERRACTVVLLPRATHRYQSIRDPLTALRMRLRESLECAKPSFRAASGESGVSAKEKKLFTGGLTAHKDTLSASESIRI